MKPTSREGNHLDYRYRFQAARFPRNGRYRRGKEKREPRRGRWLFLLALLPLDFGHAFLQFQQYGEGIRVRVDAEILEAAVFTDFKQQVLFVLMRPRLLACRARII